MSLSPESGATRRIVLHIGLHKTGTTYVQNLWRVNRAQLAEQGIYYPGGKGEPIPRFAVYDLLGKRPRGVDDHRLPGQWQALRDSIAASTLPTTLISEEGLGVATSQQIGGVIDSFPDHEIHLLVTCRDLGRVLLSAWQQDLKNGKTWTWTEFTDSVRDRARRAQNPARGFWRAQDLPAILATWQQWVPAARIHIVTVPPPDAPRELLLERIATVVGFDPAQLTARARWDNASMGTSATEVIRRLNSQLDHQLNERQHGHVIKGVLVPYLVQHGSHPKYGLPVEDEDWVEAAATEQNAAVRDGGYDVVGDLDDLLPRRGGKDRRPDEFSTEELLDTALLALTGLSERYATLWWKQHRDDPAAVEPASRSVRSASAVRSLSYRTRRAGASLADRNRLAARILGGYLSVQDRRHRRPLG